MEKGKTDLHEKNQVGGYCRPHQGEGVHPLLQKSLGGRIIAHEVLGKFKILFSVFDYVLLSILQAKLA